MISLHEVIDWRGITLSVACIPNYFGLGIHHFTLKVMAPAGATLPIAADALPARFVPRDLGTYGGLSGYARQWLDAAAASA